jgi:aminoglycoside/choline kinase family phosphotransferase
MKDYQIQIARLFEQWAGQPADEMESMAQAGSDRRYFRLTSAGRTAIGAYNADRKENEAFLAFSAHFRDKNLAVPAVYAHDLDSGIYLQEDLGKTDLYSLMPPPGEAWPANTERLLKESLTRLAALQVIGGQGLNYSAAYPRKSFDAQSMTWDLNYCKHYFLKLSGQTFDEQALEDNFKTLIAHLLAADRSHFLFRDFQTRNIMVHNDQPYFIDYQGGRQGALQYDVASMIYQVRAGMTEAQRQTLLTHYLDAVENVLPDFDREQFMAYWPGYVLIRMLQTLGAYGFRGIFERKAMFLSSLEGAVAQTTYYMATAALPDGLDELKRLMAAIGESGRFAPKNPIMQPTLLVKVQSFSYKKTGYPVDTTTNGGGFAFDCRFIDNPGRIDEFKPQTGRDAGVQAYLERETVMLTFLDQTWAIVDAAVEKYLERGFTNLQINFGCTGGQHRSVYAAEKTAQHFKHKYGLVVELTHLASPHWPERN